MDVKKVMGSVVIAAGLFGAPSAPAVAGDLSNGALACYVDTYRFDELRNGSCFASWTPSTASNPTIAHFEVVGLSPGNYSYTWKDLETNGDPGCGNYRACQVPIATDTSGDGSASLQVVIRDNVTGATKTVSARARYFDGWH